MRYSLRAAGSRGSAGVLACRLRPRAPMLCHPALPDELIDEEVLVAGGWPRLDLRMARGVHAELAHAPRKRLLPTCAPHLRCQRVVDVRTQLGLQLAQLAGVLQAVLEGCGARAGCCVCLLLRGWTALNGARCSVSSSSITTTNKGRSSVVRAWDSQLFGACACARLHRCPLALGAPSFSSSTSAIVVRQPSAPSQRRSWRGSSSLRGPTSHRSPRLTYN